MTKDARKIKITFCGEVIDINSLDDNQKYNIVHPIPRAMGLGDYLATSVPHGRKLNEVKAFLTNRVNEDMALDAVGTEERARGLRWSDGGQVRNDVELRVHSSAYRLGGAK